MAKFILILPNVTLIKVIFDSYVNDLIKVNEHCYN